jgi:hypothetical protein
MQQRGCEKALLVSWWPMCIWMEKTRCLIDFGAVKAEGCQFPYGCSWQGHRQYAGFSRAQMYGCRQEQDSCMQSFKACCIRGLNI